LPWRKPHAERRFVESSSCCCERLRTHEIYGEKSWKIKEKMQGDFSPTRTKSLLCEINPTLPWRENFVERKWQWLHWKSISNSKQIALRSCVEIWKILIKGKSALITKKEWWELQSHAATKASENRVARETRKLIEWFWSTIWSRKSKLIRIIWW